MNSFISGLLFAPYESCELIHTSQLLHFCRPSCRQISLNLQLFSPVLTKCKHPFLQTDLWKQISYWVTTKNHRYIKIIYISVTKSLWDSSININLNEPSIEIFLTKIIQNNVLFILCITHHFDLCLGHTTTPYKQQIVLKRDQWVSQPHMLG